MREVEGAQSWRGLSGREWGSALQPNQPSALITLRSTKALFAEVDVLLAVRIGNGSCYPGSDPPHSAGRVAGAVESSERACSQDEGPTRTAASGAGYTSVIAYGTISPNSGALLSCSSATSRSLSSSGKVVSHAGGITASYTITLPATADRTCRIRGERSSVIS